MEKNRRKTHLNICRLVFVVCVDFVRDLPRFSPQFNQFEQIETRHDIESLILRCISKGHKGLIQNILGEGLQMWPIDTQIRQKHVHLARIHRSRRQWCSHNFNQLNQLINSLELIHLLRMNRLTRHWGLEWSRAIEILCRSPNLRHPDLLFTL